MPALTIARFASETVMGAQVYEMAIVDRAQQALDEVEPGWSVTNVVARSLRSPLSGNRRLPMGALLKASARVRREMGRVIYPKADLVHRMKVGLPPAPHRDVLTLHDIGPWLFPDEFPPFVAAKEEIRRATAIVCPSAFTANEIQRHFGAHNTVVIPNGIDVDRFADAEPATASELRQLGVDGPYVMAAGGASQRKNLEGLADAWKLVRTERPDLSLVLTGPPHPRRTDLLGSLPGVRLVGRVPDALVPRLMKASQGLVVPSIYEGFGLPALEAMVAGVPLVAVNRSSLPEVVGDGGLLVEPDGPSIAQGILDLTSGHGDVDQMVARGLAASEGRTWERSARQHAELWTALV